MRSRIVRDLVETGILLRGRSGRRSRYTVVGTHPLEHPLEARRSVGKTCWLPVIRIPSISVTFSVLLDVPSIPRTRTGSYSFHSEKFRKSYRIFRNRYNS